MKRGGIGGSRSSNGWKKKEEKSKKAPASFSGTKRARAFYLEEKKGRVNERDPHRVREAACPDDREEKRRLLFQPALIRGEGKKDTF